MADSKHLLLSNIYLDEKESSLIIESWEHTCTIVLGLSFSVAKGTRPNLVGDLIIGIGPD